MPSQLWGILSQNAVGWYLEENDGKQQELQKTGLNVLNLQNNWYSWANQNRFFFHLHGPNARVLPWVILKDLLLAFFTIPCLCSHTSAKIATLKTNDETRNLKIGRPSKTQDRLSMASSWAHPTHRDEEAAKKDGYCLGIVYGPLLWHLLVTFLEKHNLVHRAQTTFYAAFYENGKQGKFTLPSFTAWARKFFQCEDSETTLLRCKSKFSIRLSCQKTWWLNCSGSLNQNYKSS